MLLVSQDDSQHGGVHRYIDLLDAYLLPSVDKLFADNDFVFQHDLAPAHRPYKTVNYLKEKRIDVLEWPCNSPDLSIIEFVWQKMKTRVQQIHLVTLEEIKAVLRGGLGPPSPRMSWKRWWNLCIKENCTR